MSGAVVLVGANGQLGSELQRLLPAGIELQCIDRQQLDIIDRDCVQKLRALQPSLIINAAAYTAVDRAEQEAELAWSVNADGAAHLAEAAVSCRARLIHVSTDFIFDGRRSTPYPVDAPTAPLGVYGASKLAGEERVREIAGDLACIVRTAWVYSRFGSNFVMTMLRLMRERESLGVVADQVGTPSWARGIAAVIWEFAGNPNASGTWHWTDLGVASWYDFALAIQEEALTIGLLDRAIPLYALRSEDYPSAAARPPYSVLDKTGTLARLNYPARHWRQALRDMLKDLAEHGDD